MHSLTVGKNMKVLEASYSALKLIVKSKATEVIGETMIKPAAKLKAKFMAEDKVSKAIDDSLSNNTVHC
jgi:hypothetical protein